MAKMTPIVRGDRLIYQQNEHEQVLAVETPAWFAWLATASAFAFKSDNGTFTARKERAGNQRGGWYWKAYRTQHGKHFSLYLGKAEALTLERLNAVAQALAHTSNSDTGREANVERQALPLPSEERHVMTTIRSDPPLATKLYVPQLPLQIVRRPHLVERLQQAVERPLTLIAAPAGFGKTTLISSWLQQAPLPVAWISLEHDDDDLTRFWSYVFIALSRVHPGIGTSALALLQASTLAPLPPIETVLAVWINDLAALPHEVALVLDDYHVITAQAIHRSLTYLLDHLPPQLHLVIATRADPPLSLARLRAHGHLTEIRAADLRFTSEETAAFLTCALGLELSAQNIATLEARTEGWIAGLQLAALSMQEHKDIPGFLKAFTGSHRYIIDYLVEEVLARQPKLVQTFLLQTAILERLQGPLCEAVVGVMGGTGEPFGEACGETGGQAMLEQLEQANLFLTPLDDSRLWYRYHQLFAEALRHRLQRTHPALIPELHRRASAWYEQQGLTRDAIYHALAATDFVQAAHLIEQTFNALVRRGEIATLQRWAAALPDELVRSNIELAILQGWLLFVSGKHDEALLHLQDIEHTFGISSVSDEPRVQQMMPSGSESSAAIKGRLAAIRASIALTQGDLPHTITLSRLALEYLPKESMARSYVAGYLGKAHYFSGDIGAASSALEEACRVSWEVKHIYGLFLVIHDLAHLHILQGHLHQADQTYRQALQQVLERSGHQPAMGPAYVGRGNLEREWNHLDAALSLLQEGIKLCEQTGNTQAILQAYIGLAFIHQARGDAGGASALMQQAVQRAERQIPSQTRGTQVEAAQAWLFLMQGDEAAVLGWVQRCGLRIDQDLNHLREREYLTLVRVLIAQHRLDEAVKWLANLLQLAEAQGRTGSVIEILMLQAEALHASGEVKQAIERLSQALSRAEPESYIRLFVDEGIPMARLLVQLHARRKSDQPGSLGYREKLLALLGKTHVEGLPHLATVVPGIGTYPLSEPLSEREMEVLRLIGAGCSNREIADRLVIAVSTVKWYVNAIYGKLQVQSRTRAVARARELDIM
jgi:LuxR family transcriptional regulator, maltose regulon positive regulatory protein